MESENGRDPEGQALVNGAQGRHPTGFDPSRYEVGQRLWCVPNSKWSQPYWVQVASIGRKWVKLAGDHGRECGKVEKGSFRLDGEGFSSPGRLYASPERHLHEVELDEEWRELRKVVAGFYSRPDHLGQPEMRDFIRAITGKAA